MRRTQLAQTMALLAGAAVLLSGCDTWHSAVNYIRASTPAVCPDAAILANTSVIPVFDPAKGADPSNVVYTATITGVSTRCNYVKRTSEIDGAVTITFKATRPPGGEEDHYKIPYFIAVTAGGEIVDKKIHWLEFDFPKSATTATMKELVDSIDVPVARDKHSFDYHFLIGFQLTQSQLDFNKKMGQYLP